MAIFAIDATDDELKALKGDSHMSLNNLIANGGKVLVVGSLNKAFEQYRKYPQLEFWSGEQKDIVQALKNKDIPANCNAVIISRFISHSELEKVMAEARRRNITMFPNKNDGEINKLLDEITQDVKVDRLHEQEAKQNATRGKLNPLIPFIDFNKTNVENMRILIVKAKELGIATTEMSLSQWVAIQRKKKNGTAFPASIKRNRLDLSVEMLDGMIRDLSGMRDYLIEITEENRIIKAKYEKLLTKMKGLLED